MSVAPEEEPLGGSSAGKRASKEDRWARQTHASQTRKGKTVPYAAHPLGVSCLVLDASGNEDEVIAGLLHNAVEDFCGLPTLNVIEFRFGKRVAEFVLACSDSTDEERKKTV